MNGMAFTNGKEKCVPSSKLVPPIVEGSLSHLREPSTKGPHRQHTGGCNPGPQVPFAGGQSFPPL